MFPLSYLLFPLFFVHPPSQLAVEALSTVLATDFKSGEIEIGISSTAEDEPMPKGTATGKGLWRQMDEEEKNEWLVKVGEKD